MTDPSQIILTNESDPYRKPEATQWDIVDASQLADSLELEADVVIVGSGAGGGTAAETLSKAGLSVIVLEAGPLKTSSQFDLQEREAYRDLYQEGTGRATKDASITILQGRSVGGSTTVNWTSSFRTPEQTLEYWAEEMGVEGCSNEEMAPYFAAMEERLGIEPWAMAPNVNNAILAEAADKLGYSWQTIPRNVRHCLNLGYCGLGCPVDAKQSMLVTTIPEALRNGARLVHRAQVERVIVDGDSVQGVDALALDSEAKKPTGKTIKVRAKRTVLAGGGIQTPGILMRSAVPDPYNRIGKRTFLHPTAISNAIFDRRVDPYYGAPQSIYSDHFQWQHVSDGPVGFKLEVPPLQPAFAAGFYSAMGETLTGNMDRLADTHSMIALMRDGFHEQAQGGEVVLDDNNRPLLDYRLTEYLLTGARRAILTMVEMQFAVGAKTVRPLHRRVPNYTSWQEAKAGLESLDFAPSVVTIGSAHVMGGCAMGKDPTSSVATSEGKFHQLDNLYILDGSLFPTSIGANPQLSIYGLVLKNASKLAAEMKPA